LDNMDAEALSELRNRLDHIEAYLERLSSTTSYPYARYGGGTGGMTSFGSGSFGSGSFDSGPASFGPTSGFSDVRGSNVPLAIPDGPPAASGMIGGLPADIVELAGTRKIEAIKLLRERTGMGLKEAKDAIDAVVRG
jgi:Ribosomal protein L7/L12 C-terminal domain